MLRSTRSPHTSPNVPTEALVAPASLRRRVLATVGRQSGPKRRPDRIWIAAVAVCAAVALGATLALVLVRFGGEQGVRSPNGTVSARAPVVSLRPLGNGGELEIEGMPEPPIGEVYELWLDRPGSPPQPTDALFNVTSAGRAAVEIPSALHGLRSVMVTAEPLGGSVRPTSAPVLRVAVPR